VGVTERQCQILVVDDDQRIRTMLSRYLSGEGFRVSEAADGHAARTAFDHGTIDLVLLDLVMPGEDGFAVARLIRQRSDVPIIMLTGKGDLIDRVAGLEAGADDYIGKPFHLREVLARIRTVLRRSHASSLSRTEARDPETQSREATALTFDGWEFDLARRELRTCDGNVVSLTTGEFDLLRVFVLHPQRVLSRDQLMDMVKGRDWSAYDRAIDTQIVRIRKKIESDPSKPTLIKTVRSAGYVFAASVTAR
jgi:two-component system phosphate regulon response regulator OmpR